MYHGGTKVYGTFEAKAHELSDIGRIRAFLLDLVESIGMTELGTHIYDVPIAVKRLGGDVEADEGGVTAVTVLSTSHIAIHTWPEEGGARFDVDSCRSFPPSAVVEAIQRSFKSIPDEIDFHIANYPHRHLRAGFSSDFL